MAIKMLMPGGNMTSRCGKPVLKRPGFCKSITATLVATLALSGLTACKATDFFTETVVSPYAEEVDWDNPDKLIFNSLDAQEETDELSKLDSSEETPPVDTEEKLATWASKDVNTTLSARHSVFDVSPKLLGIESSDTVKLKAEDDADAIDEAVKGSNDKNAKSKSTGSKGAGDNSKSKSDSDNQSKEAGKSDTADSSLNGGGDNPDETDNGENDGKEGDGKGKGRDGDDGNGDNPENEGDDRIQGGGYADDVHSVYDPGDKFQKVQNADHVAAMGQAAVIVQSIGGKGALCAMDEDTYNGKDANGNKTTASSFSKVFSDELTGGKDKFEKNALLWKNDGSSKKDLTDKNFKKLIKRVGANGVIFYLGEYGDERSYFTDKQLEDLVYASIQLVPVDLGTVQGIKDAVKAVGDVLSKSKELEEGVKTEDRASFYNKTLDNLVKAAGKSRAKKEYESTISVYADGESSLQGNKNKFTEYNSCPLKGSSVSSNYVCLGLDFQTGLTFKNDELKVNCEDGLLFTHLSYKTSPVSFWFQCVGALDCGVAFHLPLEGDSEDSLYPIWQIRSEWCNPENFANSSSGPISKVGKGSIKHSSLGRENTALLALSGKAAYTGAGETHTSTAAGLGGRNFPFLVVDAASDGTSAKKIKETVVDEMGTKGSAYYATKNLSDAVFRKDGKNSANLSDGSESVGKILYYTLGVGWEYGCTGSVFKENGGKSGATFEKTVIANPKGLLGSWTKGTMESVLETSWAAAIYAEGNGNKGYEPLTSLSKYKVDVDGDGTDETSFKSTVVAFYKTFYRMSSSEANAAYDDVVIDKTAL